MKKIVASLLALFLLFSLTACGEMPQSSDGIPLTDALGNRIFLPKGARAVACNGSFADLWLLSGGNLCGVTQDAIEQGVVAQGEYPVVGSVKQLNLEQIAALNPDYVLLSADLAAHLKLGDALASLNIAHGYFRVDTFDDYKNIMKDFCSLNGREDLYEKNVLQVETHIRTLLSQRPVSSGKTVLLVRVYSSGMKAKGDDILAGQMLKDLGLVNIAHQTPSLLEDLSLEKIVAADPDYILALPMGEEAAARETFRQITENPAMAQLNAVKNGNCRWLPKDLFHYKPNERWGESYEYLANIFCP